MFKQHANVNDEKVGYNGKNFSVPEHSKTGFEIIGNALENSVKIPTKEESPIIHDLNTIWDRNRFLVPRTPVSLGYLTPEEMKIFSSPNAIRTLDMPIKFPGSNFRVPDSLAQFKDIIQKVANYEAQVNKDCYDEYYCYLTVDQSMVRPTTLQREAPCHVDGFQGARWKPKTKINHTYVMSDHIPTAYYVQPFDLNHLDEEKHNFFWEMNKIVADTKSAHVWYPKPGEISLMDAYCVHRGSEADTPIFRTWIRLSFEVRIFDRLGNAHNPLFNYEWEMQKRDIESLNLESYDPNIDPSLRVFPWQDKEGNALSDKTYKTKPNLRGES